MEIMHVRQAFGCALWSPKKSRFPFLKTGIKVAERGGFEPPERFNPFSDLANRRYRPLSHLSVERSEANRPSLKCKAVLGEWGINPRRPLWDVATRFCIRQ